ncbi:MAG TPA: HAMP domain-containing sensor histidine kinase [Acetobacteraceae bacterium]|nr:HAMP domain-containing sensor histidine kinase [Acetobacteraceae bacterium]
MRLPEVIHSTTFRWAMGVAVAFSVCTLLLFGFVYWQTAAYVTGNMDATITADVQLDDGTSPPQVLHFVQEQVEQDPRRVKLAGLFGPDGGLLAGNIAAMPPGVPLDGMPHSGAVIRVDNRGRELQEVRIVGRRLESGDVLLVARNADEARQVGHIVARGLALGLVPAVCLALVTGTWLSKRAQRRIDEMNRRVQRVIAREFKERLPVGAYDDPLNRLAKIVNDMLGQIERLVGELSSVGDDIAHDLRTPLTRVRAILERGRDNARTLQDMSDATDRAIAGLDQSLAIITALLRIAEIDHSRRSAAMTTVRLQEILRAVHELYHPIAEDKAVSLRLVLRDVAAVSGDHDLLLEAVANLVDNAVKFTPPGGAVSLFLLQAADGPLVRIEDTGPGISEAERDAIFARFYRSDRSRHAPGFGLGLSLVAAIVKLHGFRLAILDGPGCRVEIACQAAPTGSASAGPVQYEARQLPLGGVVPAVPP